MILGEIVNKLTPKYPVSIHNIAYLKTSEEPVFVINITGPLAEVRRPIQGADGVRHVDEKVLVEELETREQKVINEMEFSKFQLEQRDALANARMEASRPAKEVLPN